MAKPILKNPPIRYTDKLYNMLIEISNNLDPVSVELIAIDEREDVADGNNLQIELVDVSKSDWSFDITVNGKVTPMKVGMFVRYFLPSRFSEKQIYTFAHLYEKIRKGGQLQRAKTGTKIEVPEFKLNPKDVRSTFISLVTSTYPHPNEEKVVKFLPTDLSKDRFGNYFKVIGESETMFTCHLDTADRGECKPVTLYTETRMESTLGIECEFITTDETTILGADDKAGVSVLMYMMAHNVPGVYYLFVGEERGTIGSSAVAEYYDDFDYLKNLKRCVSFDRKNYFSVITEQIDGVCCSDDFAKALCGEFNKSGMKLDLDPTGIYTDSACFMKLIPECTNVSVGYFHEHTEDEIQNITYLTKLAESAVKVDWESLPSMRKVGIDPEMMKKYGDLMYDVRETGINLKYKFEGENGWTFLKLTIEDVPVQDVYEDMLSLTILFDDYKLEPDIYYDGNEIKIHLK